jgi:hypothetical protein
MNWMSALGIFILGVSPSVYVNQQLDVRPTDLPVAVTEVVLSPSVNDDFAQCLTASGAVKFGADTCSHCARQKELFGDAFQYVDYVECTQNPERCAHEGITGYPTWIYYGSDGLERHRVSGVQTLTQLSEETDCAVFQ